MILRRCSGLFLVCAFSGFAAVSESAVSQAKAALARLPLRFEANQGQWDRDVRYAARAGSGALLLTTRGATLMGGGHRVDIALLHANRSPRIEALEPMRARTNYFIGSQERWRRGIENFTRIAYRSVYPGVDIIYYGSGDQLEYDFVLRPGADPNSIRLGFGGADRVRLTPEGDLSVESGGAQFIQKRPVIYQQDPSTSSRQPVEGGYELRADGTVGLRLSSYDRSRGLVIDPVVTYSVFIGGGSTDVVNVVATDSLGFIYIGGSTANGDLTVYGNAVQGTYSAATDGFVAMLDPNTPGPGTWVYFTYLGGGRDDAVTAMMVDAAGNLDVTGTTTSSDFPITGPSVQTKLSLSTTSTSPVFPTDAFVTIFSVQNGLLYSTYYGGSANETPRAIARDGAGRLYIFGTTTSPDLPVTASAYQNALWGSSDTFLAAIDLSSTTLFYATYLGGESSDDGRAMVVGPNGLVYFAASSFSQLFPITGFAYSGTSHGVENLVIGVIDPTQQVYGSLLYTTYLGGSVVDEVRSMTIDANGKLVLTGWTISPDFPVTQNAMQPALAGTANAFVMRVNPSAVPASFIEYSTFLGGSVSDVAYDVAIDAAGNYYLTGYTLSPNFPVTRDAVQPQFGNGADVFVVKLNPGAAGKAALLYGTYLGGTGTHVGTSLALAPNGAIYVAGYTTPDWHLTGAQNIYNGGGSDGFIAVLK